MTSKLFELVEHARHDVRHAWRSIARMPAFAAVVVVSLGAGIGVNTVVFSWIQARVLEPLPGVEDGAAFQLVAPRTEAGLYTGSSWPEYRDLQARQRLFRELLAFRMVPLYVGETGRVERNYGLLVSGNYFAALGLTPVVGRLLHADDVLREGGEPVAVISYGLWQRRFGGLPRAIGQALRVNGRDLSVVGVTPDEFQGTVSALNFDIFLPATLGPVLFSGSRELDDRSLRGYSVMGRLQETTTRAQAQGELNATMTELAHAYPETNATMRAEVLPFWQSPGGPQRLLTNALAILQTVMLLLLLAICGNTANLVLARASTRQKEIGVRLTLGASPWRIVSLLLTETTMLALLGAVLGIAIAIWGTRALQLLPLTGFPIRFQTSVDGQGLAVASILGIVCGVLVGAAAAAHLARVDPQLAFRKGSRTASRSLLRNVLMGVQTALALVVLIVAGLFLRGFLETRSTDPGFTREGVLLAAYDFSGRGATPADTRVFADTLLERLRARPGVVAAAIATAVPLDIHGLPTRTFTVEGRARADGRTDQAVTNTVTPGYFALMKIPFRTGKDFAALNDESTAPQAIVNEAFVRRYLPDVEPIGRRIQTRGRTYAIIGVVRNSLSNAFGEPPTPALYLSYRDNPAGSGEIHVRTRTAGEGTFARDLRRVVGDLDPELPVFNVRTLTDHVETNLIFRRVPARMFAVLGPLLLALASIGIYAVVAYTVSLRTTEVGVRVALGASVPRLLTDLMGDSLRVILVGALIGWLLAFIAASDLMDAGAIDVPVFFGVPAVLLAVATMACWIPARRAARIDPAVALRQE